MASEYDSLLTAQPSEYDALLNAEREGPPAPPAPTLAQKAKGAALAVARPVARGLDWFAHLGQPQVAKNLVQKIQTDPNMAPQVPQGQAEPLSKQAIMMQMLSGGVGPGAMPFSPEMDVRPAVAAGVDMATSPTSYLGAVGELARIPILGKLGQAVKAAPERGATALASKLTHVEPAALTAASTGAGRSQLAGAVAGRETIGERLQTAVRGFSKMPEKQEVGALLKQMPPVDISQTIGALEQAKPAMLTGAYSPAQAQAVAKIDEQIAWLRGKAEPGQFPKTKYSAEEAKAIREHLDNAVDFDNPQAADAYNRAMYAARTNLKDQLIESGKTLGPEYEKAMANWSDKLDLLSEIRSLTGKGNLTDAQREIKSGGFLNTLFHDTPAAAAKRRALGRFDEAAGTNFLEEAKQGNLAHEFGPTGKPAVLPASLGHGGYGLGAGSLLGYHGVTHHNPLMELAGASIMAGSSPAVATRALIPMGRLMGQGGAYLPPRLPILSIPAGQFSPVLQEQ